MMKKGLTHSILNRVSPFVVKQQRINLLFTKNMLLIYNHKFILKKITLHHYYDD